MITTWLWRVTRGYMAACARKMEHHAAAATLAHVAGDAAGVEDHVLRGQVWACVAAVAIPVVLVLPEEKQ